MSSGLVVLVLTLCVTTATACSCIPMISDEELCKYNIIIRGFLLSAYEERLDPLVFKDPMSVNSQNKNLVYAVKVEKIIKMPKELIKEQKIAIRTHYQDSMCGTRFPLDYSFLIFAQLREDGKIYTGLCEPNQEWDTLNQKDNDLVNSLPTLCADYSRQN